MPRKLHYRQAPNAKDARRAWVNGYQACLADIAEAIDREVGDDRLAQVQEWIENNWLAEYRRQTLPQQMSPSRSCSVCGAEVMWVEDAWVCTADGCGAEWYPDHDPVAYAPPE